MLSIVVIGRDEAEHIELLGLSIKSLIDICDFPIETIYVDSASSDNSVELAKQHFDEVHELVEAKELCASAGRYVGTLEAQYPWIFYIDGDMEICPDFFPVIAGLPDVPADWAGIVGGYVHRFDNGTTAYQSFAGSILQSEWAAAHGGAVILRRDAVLEAGNWSPGVYGKEELELYARIGNGQKVVRYFSIAMIYHYSEAYTRLELFLRLLYPSRGMGKVFFGYGQSLRSLSIAGKLGALMRLDSEPYLFWLVVFIGIVVASLLPLDWALLLIFSELIILSLWMRPGSVMRYMTMPISLVLGWGRYIPYFRPVIRRWSSSE